MATAIEFENISKQYRLGLVSTKTLSHDINRWWQTSIRGKEDPYLKIGETNDRATKGDSEYVWALKDINFKVEQGDVVGIIGKNGAGKSTLLKLLSRVTAPTTGTIRARGRIASLLEVGTGFHPEMTGRENIYLNGAIMGMTKREIDAKLDEIVDFSGCERYLDTPVKRYSSGMTVRLGFAVAAHLDPEILVVDEVLAVGDAEFQKKAIGKMQDVSRGEGRTVLFVSHNMGSIRSLCKTGILLDKGRIARTGEITDVINHYQSISENSVLDLAGRKTLSGVSLVDCSLIDPETMLPIHDVFAGKDLIIRLTISNTRNEVISDLTECTIGIAALNGEKGLVLNDVCLGKKVVLSPGETIVDFKINRFPLTQGRYHIGFYLESLSLHVLDTSSNVKIFSVDASTFYTTAKVHHNTRFLVDYDINVISNI